MRMVRFMLGVGLAWLILAGEAWAGSVYQYVFDKQFYAINPGGTVDVKVSLQETVSGTTSVLANDGLIGAGVRVTFFSPAVAAVLSQADILPNTPSFDGGSIKGLGSNYAEITEVVGLTSPAVTASPVAPNTYQIFLGTFRFTGLSDGSTTLRAADIPSTSDTITGGGVVLDSLIQSRISGINVPSRPAWSC